MLVIFGGLPGTGKTTIAKALVAARGATYVRVDAIEHALKQRFGPDIGAAGYAAAYAVASSNLSLGGLVVADSVNPVAESRAAWRDIASRAGSSFVEVEISCSDRAEHRRRVESRTADIADFVLPSWEDVRDLAYSPWTSASLHIDTATCDVAQAVATIGAQIDGLRRAPGHP